MVSMVSRQCLLDMVMDDAYLYVGIEDGQGLQSAGHVDDGRCEAHDHSMLRVISAMINNDKDIYSFLSLSGDQGVAICICLSVRHFVLKFF